MKKMASVFAMLVLALSLLAGCGTSYQDGLYHAEFKDYDSHGWKEYVDVQVADNKVTVLTFDGVNADGAKKSEDEDYRASMEPVKGTYPEKFYADITNQYLESGNLKDVTTVAGATVSTDNFKLLMSALEANMKNGNTDTMVVDSSSSEN